MLHLGEFAQAREHLEAGIALYDLQQHRPFSVVNDPKVTCLSSVAFALWFLGYPDQAQQRNHEALTLAYELSHPYSLGYALSGSATVHHLRREVRPVQEQGQVVALSTEQGFPVYLVLATIWRGWTLAEQGQIEEGISQMRRAWTLGGPWGQRRGGRFWFPCWSKRMGKAGRWMRD